MLNLLRKAGLPLSLVTMFIGISAASPPDPAQTQPQTTANSTEPALSLTQRTTVRCAAAFALAAQGQKQGDASALQYPPLDERGREFFVRSAAQLMDDTGMSREEVAALIIREVKAMASPGSTQEIMPACLLMLENSGL